MFLDTGPDRPAHLLAPESRTLADMFQRRIARSGPRNAWFVKERGTWVPSTWAHFGDRAAAVARGLVELGLEPGDRVAVLGPTRPEWVVHDMGAQLAGCVSLGIYPKQSPEQVRYILEHSGARVLTLGDARELETVLAAVDGLDTLEAIVLWDEAWMVSGRDDRLQGPGIFAGEALDAESVQARVDSRAADDPAIFVYTSGTTGPPKCAMLTHENILWLMKSAAELSDFRESDLTLSFLPMAHVAERILSSYARINCGFAAAFASSIAAVLDELGEVRPTVFGSVPRIFEKAYGKVRGELEKQPPLVQKLVAWSEKVGRARAEYVRQDAPVPFVLGLKYAIADRIIFRKVREAFGGRVKFNLVGAAPTPIDVLEFFWAAGLPMLEVYGQTEGTGVSHANRVGDIRLGTVGRLLPGLECRIAEDGEILVRGPSVFGGYFRDPEATARTIVDGWLHTGDIGTIDADGFLRITDRKKHIIITAGGKNLTPANIESAIKAADPLIGHAHAHGDRRKFVSALVVPGPLETLAYGEHRGIVGKADVERFTKELLDNPAARSDALTAAMAPVLATDEYRERIRRAIRAANENLSQVEKIKRFVILDRDFCQEGGELTPTMKIKRKVVDQKYAEILDRIYDEPDFALVP